MTSEILTAIRQNGFAFIRGWRESESLLDVAASLGKVVDVERLYQQRVPTVQTLMPHLVEESNPHRYSGVFGLGDFPLHTDLAHWSRPPRYFILRARVGSESVSTNLLSSAAVLTLVPSNIVRRALTRPRQWGMNQPHCLLPLIFSVKGVTGIRWDSVFLIPVNEPCREVAYAMSKAVWDRADLQTFKLSDPGDTLIVDNWRNLHGRSKVPHSALGRRIERLYLSELEL